MTTPDDATQRALEKMYVAGGRSIKPVVSAILKHPALYEGPRMVKSPVLFNAGLLRRLGRGVDTTAWVWLGQMAGQQLFNPPNVAGWDDSRWLDTATWRGRWWIATYVLRPYALDTSAEMALPSAMNTVRVDRCRVQLAGLTTRAPMKLD